MILTLNCLTDIYSKPNRDGIQKLVKRNVNYKRQFDSNVITAEQYITSKGEISRKWCMVKNNEEYIRVKHSFEELERLINPPQLFIKGYKRYEK